MKLFAAMVIGFVALATPRIASAQAKTNGREIPTGDRPPAGMCRIWLDDVPPAQQPAPTDCATAVRNRPSKGRVIFGDDYVAAKRGDSSSRAKPAIKGFAPSLKKPRFP